MVDKMDVPMDLSTEGKCQVVPQDVRESLQAVQNEYIRKGQDFYQKMVSEVERFDQILEQYSSEENKNPDIIRETLIQYALALNKQIETRLGEIGNDEGDDEKAYAGYSMNNSPQNDLGDIRYVETAKICPVLTETDGSSLKISDIYIEESDTEEF